MTENTWDNTTITVELHCGLVRMTLTGADRSHMSIDMRADGAALLVSELAETIGFAMARKAARGADGKLVKEQ